MKKILTAIFTTINKLLNLYFSESFFFSNYVISVSEHNKTIKVHVSILNPDSCSVFMQRGDCFFIPVILTVDNPHNQ